MWTLWLFGLPVEDRLGYWRYALFYLACGTVASITHLILNWESTVPALGAFTWFFPRARVAVVVPIIIIPLVFHWPAVLFTAFWFAVQVLQGTETFSGDPLSGGVAWWMHIDGFVAGLILAIGMSPRRERLPPWWR